MATPFMIEIGLWYWTRGDDYRHGDLSAPILPGTLQDFVSGGLLRETPDGPRKYEPTEALGIWVNGLCNVPWPVQRWVLPDFDPHTGNFLPRAPAA